MSPRAGLTQARVVEEAELAADELGLQNLTMSALAERLGVRQPSLYKHVDGLDAVHRDICIRALLELADEMGRAAVGRAGADAVRAMSYAYRGWAHRHPGRYAATLRAPAAEDSQAVAAGAAAVRIVTDVLSAMGVEGDACVDATRALRSGLHGFVSLEAVGGFGLPYDIDRSFDRLVDALVVAVESLSRAARRASRRRTS